MKKAIPFFLLCFFAGVICNAQNDTITAFAGNGSTASSGDGGPASSAAIGVPYGIAFDNSGNMFVVDISNHVVRKINTAGTITTVAGNGVLGYSGDGGPATAAKTDASNIATDGSGNLYIADGNNNVVRKVSTSGIITTIAGTGTLGYSGDGGPATAANMGNIFGIAVDAAGNIYVSDFSFDVVRKISAAGIITTFAGNGIAGYSGDGGLATAAQLHYPRGLAADGAGNVYISDITNNRIRKVNMAGIISTIAGTGAGGFSGDGGPAIAAQINTPWYLSISNVGDIYFTDVSNNRVRKISTSGIISTVAGIGTHTCTGIGGLAINASIEPVGMGIDQAQNLYITDDLCHKVFKITTVPTVIADSFWAYVDNLCNGISITAVTYSSSSLNLDIFFGDNHSSLAALTPTMGGFESVNVMHSYDLPGTYTIKMVLLNGTTPIDTATFTYNSLLCNSLPVNFYFDANGNCLKDTSESFNYLPVTVEVDSNGVAVDTIAATSGFNYTAYGSTGDVYSFRILSYPAGLTASCAGGMVTDTLQSDIHNLSTKNLALSCSGAPGYDLAEYVITQSGRHLFSGDILINNAYCNPQSATFTAQVSPKYIFQSASPSPASVTGTTITWNLGSLSATTQQSHIHFICEVPGTWLTPGDTVNSSHMVTPNTGDVNTTNNTYVIIDTVKSSYDPNEMRVSPEGFIASGDQLQYSIEFENTGNAPAQNIYILDTLSDNIIPSSLRILASSATMNVIPMRLGAYYVLKFDFPGINLLDSTHHNQCTGTVIFTLKTRTGLADGTIIPGRAGIYFDDNEVVMTNTVYNVIGDPLMLQQAGNIGGIGIYPNPATDMLSIQILAGAYNYCSITNSVGQLFIRQALVAPLSRLDISTLPAGLYYITFRGEHGAATKKFIKK